MDLLKLKATLGLDSTEYEDGLNKAESRAKGLGRKLGTGLKIAAGIGIAAATVSISAMGMLAKKSMQGYAEYEQMLGGVRKLYGNMGLSVKEYAETTGRSVDEVKDEWAKLEQAQNTVLKNAQQAYKTTGMSANEYMSIATSFSASLINSLDGDTAKAAEQTDVAMKAISDNWNTFGGDLGMIQGAFQGFAKQNYTMLDNLKLGYGGTKTEMERLIADANEYAKANGMAADLSIDSFSDIVTAIDLIQQKQNIAGTTAREASTTIAGSIGMLKASWENLVTGFADPDADIGVLMSNVAESAITAVGNIIPAIGRAVSGIATAIVEHLPQIIESSRNIVTQMVSGIKEKMPEMKNMASELLGNFLENLKSGFPNLLGAGLDFVSNLVDGIINSLPEVTNAAFSLITGLVKGIWDNKGKIVKVIGKLLQLIISGIGAGLVLLLQLGGKLIGKLWEGIKSTFGPLFSNIVSYAKQIPKKITEGVGSLWNIGNDMIMGLWNGIKGVWERLYNWFSEKIEGLKSKAKSLLGIASPSKEFAKIGKWIPAGLAVGIESNMKTAEKAIGELRSLASGDYTASFNLQPLADNSILSSVPTPSPFEQNELNNLIGDVIINLYYSADADANSMVTDIAREVKRLRMAGAI